MRRPLLVLSPVLALALALGGSASGTSASSMAADGPFDCHRHRQGQTLQTCALYELRPRASATRWLAPRCWSPRHFVAEDASGTTTAMALRDRPRRHFVLADRHVSPLEGSERSDLVVAVSVDRRGVRFVNRSRYTVQIFLTVHCR